ncbi:MAG TPA: 23S rRNA (guanosine(2251)-2'-O)-methyltransferase RlmB [bacterium]|nr:23S rRNA (guanosine(2251)-2'-O)-methyltransferase RlmB [bacterium]
MKGVVYGKNAVREWLEARLPARTLLTADASESLVNLAKKLALPVQSMSRGRLTALTGSAAHQNIALEVDLPEYRSPQNILHSAQKLGEPPLVVIFDGVQDPRNFGAVLRSADAAGVHGVVIPKQGGVSLTPAVFKTSAGAAAHVPVARVTNLTRCLEYLKEEGLWVVGACEDAPRSYAEMDFRGPAAIVLGSEGEGLRRLVREHCDFLASVPMRGRINSLNVSVAAALFFFEARRQREETGSLQKE